MQKIRVYQHGQSQISPVSNFKFRGMHLDVWRHVMLHEFVLRWVDLLALNHTKARLRV